MSKSMKTPSFVCYLCSKSYCTEKYLKMHLSVHKETLNTSNSPKREDLSNYPLETYKDAEDFVEASLDEKVDKNAFFVENSKNLKITKRKKTNFQPFSFYYSNNNYYNADYTYAYPQSFHKAPDNLYLHQDKSLQSCNFRPQQTQWTCLYCNKTFQQSSNYKNHMRTHSDERPYVCEICDIGFKERYHLKKHLLFKHTNEAKEKCRHCGKRFKDSTAVRAHERIHSDLRPYSCQRCHKAFKTSECLWHHENRSRTCGKALDGLNKHVKSVISGSRETKKVTRDNLITSGTSKRVDDCALKTYEKSDLPEPQSCGRNLNGNEKNNFNIEMENFKLKEQEVKSWIKDNFRQSDDFKTDDKQEFEGENNKTSLLELLSSDQQTLSQPSSQFSYNQQPFNPTFSYYQTSFYQQPYQHSGFYNTNFKYNKPNKNTLVKSYNKDHFNKSNYTLCNYQLCNNKICSDNFFTNNNNNHTSGAEAYLQQQQCSYKQRQQPQSIVPTAIVTPFNRFQNNNDSAAMPSLHNDEIEANHTETESQIFANNNRNLPAKNSCKNKQKEQENSCNLFNVVNNNTFYISYNDDQQNNTNNNINTPTNNNSSTNIKDNTSNSYIDNKNVTDNFLPPFETLLPANLQHY